MELSWNGGIPKSSMLMGFSLKNHPFRGPHFRNPPICINHGGFWANHSNSPSLKSLATWHDLVLHSLLWQNSAHAGYPFCVARVLMGLACLCTIIFKTSCVTDITPAGTNPMVSMARSPQEFCIQNRCS